MFKTNESYCISERKCICSIVNTSTSTGKRLDFFSGCDQSSVWSVSYQQRCFSQARLSGGRAVAATKDVHMMLVMWRVTIDEDVQLPVPLIGGM